MITGHVRQRRLPDVTSVSTVARKLSGEFLEQALQRCPLGRAEAFEPRAEPVRQQCEPSRHRLAASRSDHEPVSPQVGRIDLAAHAIDVRLTAEERDRLGALTKPTFGFPQSMQPMFPAIHNGGTTVNGVYAPTTGFGIEKGDQPY